MQYNSFKQYNQHRLKAQTQNIMVPGTKYLVLDCGGKQWQRVVSLQIIQLQQDLQVTLSDSLKTWSYIASNGWVK